MGCWLRGDFRKHAKRFDSLRTLRLELLERNRFELIEVADHCSLEPAGHGHCVAMRATQWLLDHLVDETELVETLRGETERIRGRFLLVLALPQDGSAAFGRDDRIGAVLEHEKTVADADGQRTTRTALAGHYRDDRH